MLTIARVAKLSRFAFWLYNMTRKAHKMTYKTLISADELVTHLDDPDWVTIDARFSLAEPMLKYEEYLQAHIPAGEAWDRAREAAWEQTTKEEYEK